MTRNGLIATCFVCLLIAGTDRAHGLDPSKRLTQYRHNVWRIQDGFLPSNPSWVSQTADGYLLVGGVSIDTFRFDGVRFMPWSSPAITSNRIRHFFPSKNGGFWISDGRGLSHIRGNLVVSQFDLRAEATAMFDLRAEAIAMVEEENGSVWVITNQVGSIGQKGQLCHVGDREIKCFGKADGLPIRLGYSILSDGTGGFWIGSDTSLVHWKAGVSEVYELKALRSNSGQMIVFLPGIVSLVQNSDGSLWVGIAAAGRGLGLERFSNGTFEPFTAPNFDDSKIAVRALLLDRNGNLWVATENSGLYRIHAAEVDHFGAKDGLSSNTVTNLYEDQEGVIWAVTSNGLDSFEEPRVTTYSAMEGLGEDGVASVIVSHDGTIWLANAGSLDSIRGASVSSIGMKDGLPGHQVASLLEDREGHLWVGVDDELFIYENRNFRPIPGPNRSPMGMVVGITEDVDGDIWAECASKPRKLVRIRDFKVQEEFLDSQVPSGHTLAADPKGGIWLATLDGKLLSLRKGKVDIFPTNLKDDLTVRQLEVQPDGSVLGAATEGGLLNLRAGVVHRLTKQNGLPCDGVRGFTRDDRRNWWLSTPCGYVELADSEIQKWRVDPKAVLQFRLLDALDGARTGIPFFNPAAKSPDGRLWFVGREVAQMIDPARLEKESSPRPVYVESVTVAHTQYAAQNGLRLPALTHDLQIDYTSPSLAVPQKVKFRYRLEGSNGTWQDADTRRQAFYSNLGPGQYRFTVMASNEDGVWHTQGATLQFSISPAWFQTIWFRTFCVVALFLLLGGLYQMRLRQVRHQFNVSLEARVSERTRIARELHDTLLQSFNALLLRLQTAADLLSTRPDEARRTLDSTIDQTAQALIEGRDAVQQLRPTGLATSDLVCAIGSLGQALAAGLNGDAPAFHVEVEGTPRDLLPIARDEVYRIAGEALRNAFQHAQARQVEVEIRYDRQQLRLRIRDDGRGIDPQFLRSDGLSKHYGLRGMQERAQLLAGTLTIWSKPNSGTEIDLTVPSSGAYAKLGLSGFRILARRR
jgi:signal transduction histidine kinase/ligand-binding sensor domain-containing protein